MATKRARWCAGLAAMAGACAAAPARAAGTGAAADNLPPGTWTTLIVLCLLLLVSVAFAWYRQRGSAGPAFWPDWRRWRAGERAARINVVATARLDQRTSLYEVEWDGRRLLLANGERGVRLLCKAEADSGGQVAGAAR
jgi:hypothetical protein